MTEPVRVGINGAGRIGTLTFKALQPAVEDGILEVALINDLMATPEQIAQYLKHDSVHRDTELEEVLYADDKIIADDREIEVLHEEDPRDLHWEDEGISIVFEATGKFRKAGTSEEPGYMSHLENGGAHYVLLSAPAKDELAFQTVLGVNFDPEKLDEYQAWSNASCTTNCLATVVKVLDDNYGIVSGDMSTIHGYTSTQRLTDGYHKDPRRRRAAAVNIIPTTTGAAKAIGKIFPELKERISEESATAYRVPIPDGSVVDFLAELKKDPDPEDINQAYRKASETYLKGILEYTEEPLVSSDIIGNPHSSIFNADLTKEASAGKKRVGAWYDNEMGYSTRSAELITYMARHLLEE